MPFMTNGVTQSGMGTRKMRQNSEGEQIRWTGESERAGDNVPSIYVKNAPVLLGHAPT